jgi:outer membrane protein TolC
VLQALAHDDEQVTDESQALASARQALHLARLSYGAGNTGILQVLDAERLSEQAELGVVRAEAQRYLDTAQLFLALGSGWWNTPATLPPAGASPRSSREPSPGPFPGSSSGLASVPTRR